MSLIADALKAAQGDDEPTRDSGLASRRAIAAAMLGANPPPSRGAKGSGGGMPKSLGMATAVFAVAVVAAVGVVALAPEDVQPMEQAPQTSPIRERFAALSAGAARSATQPPAQEAEAPPLPAGGVDSLMAATLANPIATTTAMLARVSSAAADSRARVALTRAELVSGGARAAAPPPVQPAPAATRPSAAAGGRFEIVVEPAGPSGEELFSSAVVAHRRNDLAGAVDLYERVLAQNPRNTQALNNLGSAYQTMGRAAQARDAFRRAIDVDVHDASAWSNLGSVLGTLGERQEAQAALGEAIRLDPSNAAAKVNLANHYVAGGLTADARSLLEEVVRADASHAEAHYALGRLLEGLGDRAGAARHYRSFLENSRGRFPQLEAPVRQRIEQLGAG